MAEGVLVRSGGIRMEVMGRLGPPAFFFCRGITDGCAARSGLPALSLGSKRTLQFAISRGAKFFTVRKGTVYPNKYS